ncbi:DUF4138 domain-containing protein [Muricauda sp. 334s03]|uniref:DUF4138 domain-containing protein n=1 Tax=Flagellimonas yonaguniensis TaxID=3031325 RepID=A0ABT5XZF5_9FLAO|nr:DUF4138 domain-containing protein [[Muricauda] yonaguniensis]MDF0716574.1 DUF4138 domain-containing protein [[Muricauda] yonaguniensis]
MAKQFFFILALMMMCKGTAQYCTDTLEVSKKYKTILIFPENISESIIGNDFGFIADLPKAAGSKFHGRILKLYYDELAPEKENLTNHTVITESGNVYDFILKLKEKPKKFTWYIKPEKAITNINGNSKSISLDVADSGSETKIKRIEIPEEQLTISTKDSATNSIDRATKELYEKDPMEYYRLRCNYIQFDKAKISRYFSRLDNVFLWLKGVYYNEDELYFQYRIENKEGLDLDINFIKHQLATNYKNSSSNQKMPLEPVFVYKRPKTVSGKSENHFVIVFKKFALDEKKEVVVELDEESGNRNLSLKIGHEIINNPIHF